MSSLGIIILSIWVLSVLMLARWAWVNWQYNSRREAENE